MLSTSPWLTFLECIEKIFKKICTSLYNKVTTLKERSTSVVIHLFHIFFSTITNVVPIFARMLKLEWKLWVTIRYTDAC